MSKFGSLFKKVEQATAHVPLHTSPHLHTGIPGLSLSYQPPWPATLVLTQEAVAQYSLVTGNTEMYTSTVLGLLNLLDHMYLMQHT